MPVAKPSAKVSGKSKSASKGSTLDIVFSGPLLFVPLVERGKVDALEVYAPHNGHPIGAVFLPGVRFSDDELDDPLCQRWPAPEAFSLLDAHSYLIEVTQSGKSKAFAAKSIPDTNHKIKPGRRISHEWEVSVGVSGQLVAWTSHRLVPVTQGMWSGADAPTAEATASLHRLTYEGVKAADFYGASALNREYLRQNVGKGGTLIVIGEIPYQSSLLHERRAIDAMAKLAGLDLHLVTTTPQTSRAQVMHHLLTCGFSVVVV